MLTQIQSLQYKISPSKFVLRNHIITKWRNGLSCLEIGGGAQKANGEMANKA
jgi:hypothetical protein